MDCFRPYLKRWLCLLLLAGAAARPAVAQTSMVFTKPADIPTDKANDFMVGTDHSLGALSSGASVFGNHPTADFDVLPGAQPVQPLLTPDQIKQWQKSMDDKNNWTLVTPEEIFGLPTPEKIFGLPDPNDADNLTATERYMNHEERQQSASATNALREADSLAGRDTGTFDQQNSWENQKYQADRNASLPFLNNLNNSGRSPDGSPLDPAGADASQNPDSLWHSAFSTVPTPPKPDPAQVALMEHFQALLAPQSQTLDQPAMGSGLSSPLATEATPAPAPDPNMQPMPSSYNAVGHSFAPLEDTASRPMGITPLPTITGQTPNNLTPPVEKPLVSLPPWMSSAPPSGRPAQIKY